MYGRPGAAQGWHFLTGEEPQIKQLAARRWLPVCVRPRFEAVRACQRHHDANPAGKISRYFYGISYPERDLRLGLVDASQGKIGSPVDQVLLFCYHYDPHTGKYGLLISRVLQLAGGLTVLCGDIFLSRAFPERATMAPRAKSGRKKYGLFKLALRSNFDGMAMTGLIQSGFSSVRAAAAMIPLQPPAASTIAGGVDKLYYVLTGITAFFAVLIFSIIFYFMVKVSPPLG